MPTLTQLAESIAMTQNGDLSGVPLTLLNRAIALDPNNEHALWLSSIAKQQAGDHEQALEGFDKLMGIAQGDPEALATISQMRAHSVDALNISEDTTEGPSLEVVVTLSDKAKAASSDEQFVFIYATASEGPPMPLAVQRITVADLPSTITLDNSMAMIPTMTLSSFPSVTVGARISTTGTPTSQTGDWFVEIENISPEQADTLNLVIDGQTP